MTGAQRNPSATQIPRCVAAPLAETLERRGAAPKRSDAGGVQTRVSPRAPPVHHRVRWNEQLRACSYMKRLPGQP